MRYTKEQLDAQFEKLPVDVKTSIESVDSADIMIDVGKKHGLRMDAIGKLADETGYVMFGLTAPQEYVKNLTVELGVSEDVAVAVAKDINEKIFLPVRDSLKQLHSTKQAREEVPAEHRDDLLKAIESPESQPMTPKYVVPQMQATVPKLIPVVPPVIAPTPKPFIPSVIPGLTGNPGSEFRPGSPIKSEMTIPTQSTSEKPKSDPYRELS